MTAQDDNGAGSGGDSPASWWSGKRPIGGPGLNGTGMIKPSGAEVASEPEVPKPGTPEELRDRITKAGGTLRAATSWMDDDRDGGF